MPYPLFFNITVVRVESRLKNVQHFFKIVYFDHRCFLVTDITITAGKPEHFMPMYPAITNMKGLWMPHASLFKGEPFTV